MGQHNNALAYYQKSLSTSLELLGPDHPHIGNVYSNMIHSFTRLGRYEEALSYAEKALKILRKAYGEENIYVAYTENFVGELHEESELMKKQSYTTSVL